MIKSVVLSADEIRLDFVCSKTGVFKAFGREHRLLNQSSLVIKFDSTIYYKHEYLFKDENSRDWENVVTDGLKPLDDLSIIYPSGRSGLSAQDVYFIARNIALHYPEYIRRCNASVVMGYRALDIGEELLTSESITIINALIDCEKKYQSSSNKDPKLSSDHILFSMLYLVTLMSIFCSDEDLFIESINKVLVRQRLIKDDFVFLFSSYTLVLCHRLAACYLCPTLSVTLYNECINIVKRGFKYLSEELNSIELNEVSHTAKRLSDFKGYISLEKSMDDLFRESLRCGNQDVLISNFKKFHFKYRIDLIPSMSAPEITVDALWSKALDEEQRVGNIKKAYEYMVIAFKARPAEIQIINKIKYYESILLMYADDLQA